MSDEQKPSAVEEIDDLAAALDEANEVAPVLSWRGRDYELEPGLPAIVMLEAVRFSREFGEGGEPPIDRCLSLLEDLFGAETLTRILRETRTPMDAIGDLIIAGCKAYGVEIGVTAAPNRAARRSRRA